MLKILEILEERNNSLEIREWKIPTFSNGGGWGLINDVLSNSPLFCGIGGPGKNSSYTGVVLSIRRTSLAPSRSQVNCLESSVLIGSLYFEVKMPWCYKWMRLGWITGWGMEHFKREGIANFVLLF